MNIVKHPRRVTKGDGKERTKSQPTSCALRSMKGGEGGREVRVDVQVTDGDIKIHIDWKAVRVEGTQRS